MDLACAPCDRDLLVSDLRRKAHQHRSVLNANNPWLASAFVHSTCGLRHLRVVGFETIGGLNMAKKRGFAAMDKEKQKAIAAAGGHAVPKESRSFSTDRELAAASGRKGGRAVPADKRSFSRDPELAAEAGRKGGRTKAANSNA